MLTSALKPNVKVEISNLSNICIKGNIIIFELVAQNWFS
jgi:hypothetical protein